MHMICQSKVCVILCVLLVASAAVAVNGTWTNGAGDQDWFNSGNWSPSAVPGAGDEAHLNQAGVLPAIVGN